MARVSSCAEQAESALQQHKGIEVKPYEWFIVCDVLFGLPEWVRIARGKLSWSHWIPFNAMPNEHQLICNIIFPLFQGQQRTSRPCPGVQTENLVIMVHILSPDMPFLYSHTYIQRSTRHANVVNVWKACVDGWLFHFFRGREYLI